MVYRKTKQIVRWLRVFFLENITRWIVFGLLVGIVSGLAASSFYYILQLARHYSFHLFAGYAVSAPTGEQLFEAGTGLVFRPVIFFILPVIGGLISGWIVYRFAPEAEGHGTDAMIDAFHNQKGNIRARVPFIKGLASIFTLASGGSAGREGPIAQIGAGLGSTIGHFLKLSDKERRILLLAGCGGGLSAIFRAPLGGALTAIEILYKEDMETEALVPTVVSSITAYIIFTYFFGNTPIFFFPEYTFSNPRELIFYVLLGLICVPAGIFFIKVFYAVRERIFQPMKIPRYVKPALGGLVVGCIGLVFPQVYGDGWGWIQLAILGKISIGIMIAIALAKIIATSFTISSGGSGGVFGPTLFIGGMIGGTVGFSAHHFFPHIVTQPEAFVVVGMASFFAGVANAPIGTLLMCSEMTRGYGLIAPLMLVSIIAILFTRKHSIYKKQVQSKRESPAHTADFTVNIFAETQVKDFYKPQKVTPVRETTTYGQLKKIFSASNVECFPVYNKDDVLIGAINWDHARSIVFEEGLEDLIIAQDLMAPPQTVTPEDNFYDAFMKFMETNVEELLVVSSNNSSQVLGVLRHDDLIAAYQTELNRRKSE
ncbi:MAG: chloride channel protein [Deltaproteobacteria bacterium HGW-Deltaproteobacteria-1]|jgi:CIC family chloride channel protein|nr:MAG: chloride channel protein [Deltaproteobacteria bacterium HGW-Deltaproteobacteria-1]